MDTPLEDVFRRDWPVIVGAVARYTSDLALAEDTVQEAFAKALDWPVPLRNPAAWITTTARHLAVDRIRHDQALARALPRLAHAVSGLDTAPPAPEAFCGDDRMVLMTLVASPRMPEEDRLVLALRFVCGVAASDIATALLLPPATLAARLTRAKKRLRSRPGLLRAGSPMTVELLRQRLDTILDTVFLLYTAGYSSSLGAPGRAAAFQLSHGLATLFPDQLETRGLLALIQLTEARRPVADPPPGTPMGGYGGVDLAAADRSLWDPALINEGLSHATAALSGGGRFSLMAGIAGIHDAAARWEDTGWEAIAALYDRLLDTWPAPSVALNRTIARSMSAGVGPSPALGELEADFYLYGGRLLWQAWAARADLLRRLGRGPEAAAAYRRALEGASDDGDRAFLLQRIREIVGG